MADFDKSCIVWRRSTKSGSDNCVEVATADGSVGVRDSVDPSVVLTLPPAAWSAFMKRVRDKDFGPRRV